MTWVPPVYRPPGEAGPPRRPVVFPVVGAVATVLALAAAVLLTGLVSWLSSVCGDPPAVVAAQRGSLRLHLMVLWLVAAGVPAFVALLAKVRHRSLVLWIVAAVVMAGVGLVLASTAEPSTWCLY